MKHDVEKGIFEMRFSFCGKLGFFKDKPLVEKGTGKNGKPYVKIKFSVNSGSDIAFVEAFAGVQDEIKITDREKNRLSVLWADRFTNDVINKASRTFVCNLGERKAFLSQYDQILYLETLLPTYEGRVVVTGTVNKTFYEGRWYENYLIQNVYAANEESKSRLIVSGNIIFNKQSIDAASYKESGILMVSGYVEQYIDKDHPKALVPQVCVLNTTKVNREDARQLESVKFREDFIRPKPKGWTMCSWECILKNGQEEVEFDGSQLTPMQRRGYELGLYKLEDLKPTRRIYGERITELRLYRPLINNECQNGPVEYGDDATVEAQIYRPGSSALHEEDILGLNSNDLDDLFA